MEVVVVYESLFGQARQVAEAVAAGVRQVGPQARLAVLPVIDADLIRASQAELLVVGGPTHGLGMSTSSSRRRALRGAALLGAQPEPGADGPGIRDWVALLPHAGFMCRAAAFDTRSTSVLPGAANTIARRLKQHGFHLVSPPKPFFIDGPRGPLVVGEGERACAWGAHCYYALTRASSSTTNTKENTR